MSTRHNPFTDRMLEIRQRAISGVNRAESFETLVLGYQGTERPHGPSLEQWADIRRRCKKIIKHFEAIDSWAEVGEQAERERPKTS